MVTAPQPDAVQPAQAMPRMENPPDRFHWRTCWYPIAFVADLPAETRPTGFRFMVSPWSCSAMALARWCVCSIAVPTGWPNCRMGRCWRVVWNVCTMAGSLGSGGECLHIPQLLAEATIPQRARVQSFPVRECQGIVWVWADAEVAPDPAVASRCGRDRPGGESSR
jgi:hypothetical protein